MSENIFQRIIEVGGRISVKSALNPILWLCFIISLPGLLLVVNQEYPPLWLILLVVAPVCTAIVGYFFLLIFDRDKLQSEDYQLRKQSLELIQDKGQQFPIVATSIESISNPSNPPVAGRLPSDSDLSEGEE